DRGHGRHGATRPSPCAGGRPCEHLSSSLRGTTTWWERDSGQHRSSEVVGRVLDARQREEVATTERGYVVDERFVDQPGLDGFELALDVLLVAGEDQPLVEISVDVHAQVVVVRAPQDAAAVG